MSAETPLQVLLIDDNQDELWLLEDELRQAGFQPEMTRVEDAEGMEQALDEGCWDLLLVDWVMPRFSGPEALKIYNRRGPDVPFIVLSAEVDETVAVATMEDGAHDFIAKGNRARLIPAIRRELLMAERRRAQRRLMDSNRLILDTAAEGIFGLDASGNHTFVNPAAAGMLGWSVEELLGRHSHSTWHHHHPDGSAFPDEACPIYSVLASGRTVSGEEHFIRRDGEFFPVVFDAAPIREDGEITGAVVSFRDISERKQQEEILKRTNRTLTTLSQCNQSLVRAADQDDLAAQICANLVRFGGYLVAWIALLDDKGIPRLYQWATELAQDEWQRFRTEWERRAADLAANPSKQGSACMEMEPQALPGPHAVMPLEDRQGLLGMFGVCSREGMDFLLFETDLLEELASDITFGLRALHTRHERDHALAALDEALFQTIQAISATLEKRDPYTAGHQQRVAELAEAIGRNLGLDEERIKGLRVGALLHDIGKIALPAEILSRPGRLSEVEYRLVQEHPLIGYDILKDVHFPWPVTAMVLQHHENLDGSGYPNGISASDIILESRILKVSDIVEAMTSHRPYRPALSRKDALDEIRAGTSAGRYDPDVTRACEEVLDEVLELE